MVIRDKDGVIFKGMSPKSELLFPQRSSTNRTYVVTFMSMLANTDHLDLSVALIDSDSIEVFDWKRNIRLDVLRSVIQTGRIFLKPTWQLLG